MPSLKIGALLDKAEEHREKSQYVQAEKIANDVLTLVGENGTRRRSLDDEARAHCILGACCSRTARYDDALTHFHNAFTAAGAASNLGLQSRALDGKAIIQKNRGDYQTALGTAEHALAAAEKGEDKRQQARTLNIIGLLHKQFGDYPRTLHYMSRALALHEEIGNKRGVSANLGDIGGVHHGLGDCPRTLDYMSRALAIAEELGDKNMVGIHLTNIGTVHADLADYPRALDYFKRALALAEELGAKRDVTSALGNIGLACIDTGNYTRALEYLKHALDLSEQIGTPIQTAYWMKGIARIQRKMGNLDVAYQGLLDTLHHQRDVLKSSQDVADTLLVLGGVLLEQGKTQEGLTKLEEALQLAEELGQKRQAAEAHNEIAVAYAQIGDVAKELDHLKKHYAIEKEIFSEESKKRVELFNMRVAIAEIEHGVEVQKLRGERMEHDLANNAIHLAAQTELVDKFRNDLRQIFNEIDEPIAALKKIKEKLKDLPCQQIDWPKFEGRFNEVHPEFRAKLTAKFPELTHMEQRIAAMVRMDLTSSDIARLFCITERAVEFHRLNLRKKLKLKQEESLPKFLSQL